MMSGLGNPSHVRKVLRSPTDTRSVIVSHHRKPVLKIQYKGGERARWNALRTDPAAAGEEFHNPCTACNRRSLGRLWRRIRVLRR
jgi:hypothetical protein